MEINQGSVEPVIIEVTDQLGTLTELPAGTLFDVKDTDGNPEQNNLAVTVAGMKAICLIDASALAIDDYDLYLKFTSGSNLPILGPYRFRVK